MQLPHTCRVVEELLQWDRFRAVVNWRVIAPEVAFKAKYEYVLYMRKEQLIIITSPMISGVHLVLERVKATLL